MTCSLDYLQTGGSAQAHLYWYSPSQPEEVIPEHLPVSDQQFWLRQFQRARPW